MRRLKRTSKKYYFKQAISCWLISLMLFAMPAQLAMAEVVMTGNPQGTITVDPLGTGTHQAMTATDGAIGEFSDFDIASGHSVYCAIDSSASALFRVNGNGTEISGTFGADGRIFLIDSAGIIFCDGAIINVNSLVASGLDLTNFDEVLANGNAKMVFVDNSIGIGNVTVNGTLDATGTDSLYLVGENITNNGAILSNGLVVMAAGNEIHLGQPGSPVIVQLDDIVIADELNDLENNGTVQADKLVLAAGDLWSQAIDNVGELVAVANDHIDIGGVVSTGGNVNMQAADDIMLGDDVVAGGSIHLWSDAVADDGTMLLHAGVDVTIDGTLTAESSDNPVDAGYAEIVIIADTGDVIANDNIYVESIVNSGNPDENAFALIDVTAGRDITFNGDGDYGDEDLGAFAETGNGSGSATATTNINAGRDVVLNSRIKSKVEVDDSSDAITNITITGNNITTNDRVISRIKNASSGNATGTIEIMALGDVNLNGGDDYDYGLNNKIASRYGSGSATANTTITGNNITITDAAVVSRAYAYDGSGEITANVNVEATGNLDILTTVDVSHSGSWVKSNATSIKNSGDATSTTTITGSAITITSHRNGSDEGSVVAEASAYDSGGATTELNVEASGDILLEDEAYVMSKSYVETHGGTIEEIPYDPGDPIPEEQEHILNASATTTVIAVGGVTVGEASKLYSEADLSIDYEGTAVGVPEPPDPGGSVDPVYNIVMPGDATATTTVEAEGDITVYGGFDHGTEISAGGEIYADAFIKYDSNPSYERVTGYLVEILDDGDIFPYDPGVPLAFEEGYTPDVSATVDIQTCANVIVDGYVWSKAYIEEDSVPAAVRWYEYGTGEERTGRWYPEGFTTLEIDKNLLGNNTATTFVQGFLGVIVNRGETPLPEVDYLYGGEIGSEAYGGNSNIAQAVVLSGDQVTINEGMGEDEGGLSLDEVYASATYGVANDALVGIATSNTDGDIIVSGQVGAETDSSFAGDSPASSANVEIFASGSAMLNGPIEVEPGIFTEGGQIETDANGDDNVTADISIIAADDVVGNGLVEAEANGDGENSASIIVAAGNQLIGSGEVNSYADNATIAIHATDEDEILYDGSFNLPDEEIEVIVEPFSFVQEDYAWIDWQWCSDCELAPVDLLGNLFNNIISLSLPSGIENGLLAKLETTMQKLNDGNEKNDKSALNSLQAFIKAVNAQSDKKIPEGDADNLIGAAQQIIDLLNNE